MARLGVPPGAWSWTLERNPKGTGYHAHVVQRGGYVPQAVLQLACERGGAGIPYVNAIRADTTGAQRYGLKTFGATGYGLKTFRAADDARDALALNHGRLEHHSRDFFEVDGENAGVREVERRALAEQYPFDPSEYVVCNEQTARWFIERFQLP